MVGGPPRGSPSSRQTGRPTSWPRKVVQRGVDRGAGGGLRAVFGTEVVQRGVDAVGGERVVAEHPRRDRKEPARRRGVLAPVPGGRAFPGAGQPVVDDLDQHGLDGAPTAAGMGERLGQGQWGDAVLEPHRAVAAIIRVRVAR